MCCPLICLTHLELLPLAPVLLGGLDPIGCQGNKHEVCSPHPEVLPRISGKGLLVWWIHYGTTPCIYFPILRLMSLTEWLRTCMNKIRFNIGTRGMETQTRNIEKNFSILDAGPYANIDLINSLLRLDHLSRNGWY